MLATLEPVKLDGGVSLNLEKLRVGFDLERNLSQKKTLLRLGLEAKANTFVVARVGTYKQPNSDEWGLTGGLSLEASNSFSIDLGFLRRLNSSF